MSNLNNRSCHFASILDIWQWNKEKKIVIPDIQRGLVWNAAQIEVFWDSLLRNIPVGIFTAAEIGGEVILLDGQQRWHAVNVANDNRYGVLWCGIFDSETKTNIYNRQYLFRWTTDSHPWGFHFNNNEKSAPRLSISERSNLLIANNWEQGGLFRKPKAGDIKPFPCHTVKMVTFQSLLQETLPPDDFSDNEKKYWFDLQKKIKKAITQPVIPIIGNIGEVLAVNGTGENVTATPDPEWIDTFFLRMNSQGTPFSQDELAYSALKNALLAIGIEKPRKQFEKASAFLGNNTARTAQIILQILANELYGQPLAKYWYAGTIKSFFQDKNDDSEKINKVLNDIISRLNKLQELVDRFNATQNRIAVLPLHLNNMPSEVIRMALLLLKRDDINGSALLGTMFMLWWYSVPNRQNNEVKNALIAATNHIVEKSESSDFNLSQAIANCIYNMWLIPALPPEKLQTVQLAALKENAFDLQDKANDQLFRVRLEKVFNWGQSFDFVTLACGKYLLKNFPDIKNFNDDSRPWDYDHLYPQARCDSSNAMQCWSSGNNVPIALTTNRSKQEAIPDENYPDNCDKSQELLYLVKNDLRMLNANSDYINELAFKRFTAMYQEVFSALNWQELLGWKTCNDFALKAEEIKKQIDNEYKWYYILDGREFPVKSNNDFLRFKFFVLRDTMENGYVLETSDFQHFSFGKRKAALSVIGRGIGWWLEQPQHQLPAYEAVTLLKEFKKK